MGEFLETPGKVKFLVVAIDYFTKWVEAKHLTSTSAKNMEKFVWEQIVCRFGIPQMLISDNGTQFAGREFRLLCEGLCIKQKFTAVAHPQGNGQVEVTNKNIVKGIKAHPIEIITDQLTKNIYPSPKIRRDWPSGR